jgi:hypothetical protein
MFPMMYAPPWARDAARDAAEVAGTKAVDNALNASEELRRTLPSAAPLAKKEAAQPKEAPRPKEATLPKAALLPKDGQRRYRDKPFDGDIAARHFRERPSLDPVAVPPPPARQRRSAVAILARLTGAASLAALAAFFMVGMPQPLLGAVSEAATVVQPYWMRLVNVARPGVARSMPRPVAAQFAPRPVTTQIVPRPVVTERVPVADFEPAAFADRIAAFPVKAETEPVAPAQAIQTEQPAAPAGLRVLDEEEIAMLIKRSDELITQGDIAAARLTLTRAAETGNARAALALGATYDAEVLRNLGVLGVVADAGQARAWYARAAQFGSGEATRRLEQIAQSGR